MNARSTLVNPRVKQQSFFCQSEIIQSVLRSLVLVGDQLLSVDLSEIALFLLRLTCGGATLSPHDFACPTKILHSQSII